MNRREQIREELIARMGERILLLDGAMGTVLQARKLVESDHRGKEFARHSYDLRGNFDVLNLTQPHMIEETHTRYLEAGADIIETNTFNSNSISMADYGLESRAADLNFAGARIARSAVDRFAASRGGRRCFVAGSMGPTPKTSSVSQDVGNPAARAVTFDQLREAYGVQARALVEGGADLLLLETVFDTLNVKAGLFAIEEYFEASGKRVPVIVSVTIVDRSGRTLSGQTVEAFWISVAHMPLFSVGMNCALGAKQMRSFIEELAGLAPIPITCYPNAGLPNAFGGFDETPERMAADLGEFARNGWLNIAGGCCGSTPDHIRAIGEAIRGVAPRVPPKPPAYSRFSGLERW
jgi:5-methyltetrahydrofolate--homocysteine methyltransferase